jgi:predicted AAA+ superfamily ATPase
LKLLSGPDIEENSPLISRLFEEFKNYLAHGGFLTAINDVEKNGYIKLPLYTHTATGL